MHELPRIGIERFQITPLAFAEQDVKGQGRFARARDAGDDGEALARNIDIDVLEVVLARLMDADHAQTGRILRRGIECLAQVASGRFGCQQPGCAALLCVGAGFGAGFGFGLLRTGPASALARLPQRGLVLQQGASGVGGLAAFLSLRLPHQCCRCALEHQLTAGIAALGSELDQPVAGSDDIQVVFDHQQRVSGAQ